MCRDRHELVLFTGARRLMAAKPLSMLLPAAREHDLARHAFPPEQLMRAPCLGKRKSLRDQRLDLFLLKEAQKDGQIVSKKCRPPP